MNKPCQVRTKKAPITLIFCLFVADMCESEPASFHSDGVQGILVEKSWTPKTELKPFVGKLFPLYDDALSFYREYARKSGFEIRKGTTEQSKTRDGYSRRYILCNREGKKKKTKTFI